MPFFPRTALGAGIGAMGKGAWATTKFAVGGGVRRSALGSGVGAIYGNVTSDANSSTGRARDTMVGALGGLGVGMATTRTAGRLALGAAKLPLRYAKGTGVRGLAKKGWGLARGGASLGKKGAVAGLGAANWTVSNPGMALAVGGGVLGAYALSQSGAGNVPAGQEQLAVQQGRSVGHTSHIQSTSGLVQGLHRGRH